MGLGVGEEDGVDEEESYAFILGTQSIEKSDDPYLHSTYQAPKANLLILKSLVCDKQRSTPSGNDEVYFHFFTADKDKSFSYNDDDLDNSDINGQVYFFPPYDYYSMDHNDNHAWHTWTLNENLTFHSDKENGAKYSATIRLVHQS